MLNSGNLRVAVWHTAAVVVGACTSEVDRATYKVVLATAEVSQTSQTSFHKESFSVRCSIWQLRRDNVTP